MINDGDAILLNSAFSYAAYIHSMKEGKCEKQELIAYS